MLNNYNFKENVEQLTDQTVSKAKRCSPLELRRKFNFNLTPFIHSQTKLAFG